MWYAWADVVRKVQWDGHDVLNLEKPLAPGTQTREPLGGL